MESLSVELTTLHNTRFNSLIGDLRLSGSKAPVDSICSFHAFSKRSASVERGRWRGWWMLFSVVMVERKV